MISLIALNIKDDYQDNNVLFSDDNLHTITCEKLRKIADIAVEIDW